MFPIVLIPGLDERYQDKWKKQFVDPGRTSNESLWRRTQQRETAGLSNWKDENDARRRMVHFVDQYDLIKSKTSGLDLVIKNAYLWVSVTLPEDEIEQYVDRVKSSLSKGWTEISNDEYEREGLEFSIQRMKVHPEDERVGRTMPSNYSSAEFTLKSKEFGVTNRMIDSPWNILNSGIRKMEERQPEVEVLNDIPDMSQYLPTQFELGGGASLELGIPPLNHLHQIYNVTNPKDGSFIFGDDPLLTRVLEDPVKFYQEASLLYRKALLAEPNVFYKTIQMMHERGDAVGDVITNNYDGMCSLVGLNENFIRRFDEPEIYPTIDFDDRAKSLTIVGVHADRRKVQSQAREKGLKVIHIDPEEYVDYFDNKVDYPLEGAKKDDIIVHQTAEEFAESITKQLYNH